MKILFVCNLRNTSNPYVLTLINQLKAIGTDLVCSLDELWNKHSHYDIVHFQWPEAVFNWSSYLKDEQVNLLIERLNELKRIGTKVVVTCHNEKPHVCKDERMLSLYSIIYSNCDAFVHLGSYSCKILACQYPNAKHVIIPHHIYDTIYSFNQNKKECQEALGLSPKCFNVLCFGEFRNDDERNFVLKLKRLLSKEDYHFITPGFYRKGLQTNNVREFFIILYKHIKYHIKGIKYSRHFIDDDILVKYYTACDAVLIQRHVILNSGNLPMGFYAGKVVVGPNCGNVGEILSETGNPTFDAYSIESCIEALRKAKKLVKEGWDEKNRVFAIKEWNTLKIAKEIIVLYNSLI